jgi:U3 small nucleolar ribonucleoprotein protein LCP5
LDIAKSYANLSAGGLLLSHRQFGEIFFLIDLTKNYETGFQNQNSSHYYPRIYPYSMAVGAPMAVEEALPALLDTLSKSLTSALESLPEPASTIPLRDGISLLDVKNELLLSYLQNLVFLILLKIRNRATDSHTDDEENLNDVVRKLVELRVYLEKGVRSLEGRLKYQIDKVIRAANDAEKASAPANGARRKTTKVPREDSDQDSDENSSNDVMLKASEINDLQYRPNPSAFVQPSNTVAKEDADKAKDGIYRPPRIVPTIMPTTGPKEREPRKPKKSATLNEFISTELSATPLAEPSIGTNIVSGGRRSKSEREKREEAERLEYEETNYTRLPRESKKEKARKRGRQDAGYGGEEWRGLGEGLERIEILTKRKSSDARSILEKSRKRPTEDGPRKTGAAELGQEFRKRLKALDGRRRDRGRR